MAFNKLRERFHYARYGQIKKLIKDESKNLLDIGCGKPCDSMKDGAFLRYIGYGTGMDIIEYDFEFPFKKGNITNIPFDGNTFDVVIATEVLEHIEDIPTALSEVRRILRPGGVFVISTPNNSLLWKSVWFLWEKTIGRMWQHQHVTNYNKKQWIRVLSKYFRIIKVKDFLGILLIVKMRSWSD